MARASPGPETPGFVGFLSKNAPSVTAVTSARPMRAYVPYRTTGRMPPTMGDGTMSWRDFTIFTVDCAAVTAGLLIAAPFVLILVSPFIAGY